MSDDENVGKAGGEGVSLRVLDVDNLVGTWVVLNVHECSNTTNIVSALDEDGASVLEFDDLVNFTGLEVQLNRKSIKYKIPRKLSEEKSQFKRSRLT